MTTWFKWLGLGVCVLLHSKAVHVLAETMPITQQQACSRFSSAVVSVDAGGQTHGTGFIVSPDGYVLTASHLVNVKTDLISLRE